MVQFFFPPPGRVLVPVSVVFNEARGTAADNSNNTFSSVSFASAAADRWVAVYTSKRNTGQLNAGAVTIGGVTATMITPQANTQQNDITAGWYYAAVPTGISGTVQVNYPFGSGFSCYMACYSIYGAGSVISYDTAIVAGSAAQITIDVPVEMGDALTAGFSLYGNPGGGITWTGATENDDRQVDNDILASVANYLVSTTATPRTITPVPGVASVNGRLLSVPRWVPV